MYSIWARTLPYIFSSIFLVMIGGSLPLVGGLLSYFSSVPLYILLFHLGAPATIIGSFTVCIIISLLQNTQGLGIWITHFLPLVSIALSYRFKPMQVAPYYIFHMLCGVALAIMCLALIVFSPSFEKKFEQMLPSLELLAKNFHIIPAVLIRFLPGIIGISWVLMSFGNYMFAYTLAPKMSSQFKPYQNNLWYMPHMWDIPFLSGLMFILLNNWFEYSFFYLAGPSMTLFSSFPLLLKGFRNIYTLVNKPAVFWLIFSLSFILAWPLLFVVLSTFVEPWLKNFLKKN